MKAVFLTFDDGPHPDITPWALDVLKEFNAKATFFMVGENANKYPEIVKRIIENGHAVGNHTYNHLNGWKTPKPAYLENIKKCSEVFQSTLFRPPYGKITRVQAKSLEGSYKIIMWDVLSKDYDKSVSPEGCITNVLSHSRSGSIIVFHDSLKAERNLKESLPKILETLAGRGFNFLPLHLQELL
jgi:peptidoglycan-N-acetylglucosamine deacetylase